MIESKSNDLTKIKDSLITPDISSSMKKEHPKLPDPRDRIRLQRAYELKRRSSYWLKDQLIRLHKFELEKKNFNDELIAVVPSEDVLHSEYGLKKLQDYYFSPIKTYSSTFDALCMYFPQFKKRIQLPLKSEDELVLKLYDPIAFYDRYRDKSISIKDPKFKIFCDNYFTELQCYKTIWKHNNESPQNIIKIPQIYDYGNLHLLTDKYEFGGFFMILKYIPNDPNSITQKMIYDGCRQLRQLHNLGIYHNYTREENFRVHDGKIHFIDFGHATISKLQIKNNLDANKFILSAKFLLAKVKPKKDEQNKILLVNDENEENQKSDSLLDNNELKENNPVDESSVANAGNDVNKQVENKFMMNMKKKNMNKVNTNKINMKKIIENKKNMNEKNVNKMNINKIID